MTLSRILSDSNLLIKMMWSTESKALEKSRQRTNLLVSNNIDILCVISIIAVVALPVGANNKVLTNDVQLNEDKQVLRQSIQSLDHNVHQPSATCNKVQRF